MHSGAGSFRISGALRGSLDKTERFLKPFGGMGMRCRVAMQGCPRMPKKSVELPMIARWVGEAAARFGGIPGQKAALYAAEAYGFQRGTVACSAFVAAYLRVLHPSRTRPSRSRPSSPTSSVFRNPSSKEETSVFDVLFGAGSRRMSANDRLPRINGPRR